MTPWPHQTYGTEKALAAIRSGQRRILVTSPTGGGKTQIMLALAQHYLDQGKKVSLYSNRKILVDQTSEVLTAAGVYHGVRSADYEPELDCHLQISSLQTEHSRVTKRGQWPLHEARLVLVDEAHLHTGPTVRALLQRHLDAGAAYVGFTATPIDLASMYDLLIVAGTVSQLRECGALVPALHYGPDEPDLRKIRGLQEGADLSERQASQAMMNPILFGRIWESFQKINPDHRPTICFGPSVEGSLWIAEQFVENGITAAHIDGERVWINGAWLPSSRESREEVLEGNREHRICVVCNRYVLREGVDAPWLEHGIFATVFGSLQTYLQSGGRLLRSHPTLDSVTIQDHGGNWWRHGSLNDDRYWDLEYTATMAYGLRADHLRDHPGEQPFRCPRCSKIIRGPHCPCGWEKSAKDRLSRPVVTTDGTLKEITGDVFRPHRISQHPKGPDIWKRMYHRSRTEKGSRTFRAAAALFAAENNWGWPDPSWPLMPTEPMDWFRLVADVPMEKLTHA